MIVVSNTSPLTNLAAIGRFDLLHRLYREIHIPLGVWNELNAKGKRWPGCEEVAGANWIERHPIQNLALIKALQRDLDRGEAETIALALEMKAAVVLLDEREGRRAARSLDLQVVGVVGLLLEAKAQGFIHALQPCLDGLRRTAGFYLDEILYKHALTLAGELIKST